MNEPKQELLTIQEMAKILKISRSKAYALTKEKGFPIIKIGKCVRVSKESVFKWLNIM